VTTSYLDLADYVTIASEITGLSVETIVRLPRLALAESALQAPAAGFGQQEFYSEFVEKAAVLLVRLARNHPLPDGNKRAAWVSMRIFIEINDWSWNATPTVDDAEQLVLAVAAGLLDEQAVSDWLRDRISPPRAR